MKTFSVDICHLSGCAAKVGRKLRNDAHSMRQLSFTCPKLPIHCEGRVEKATRNDEPSSTFRDRLRHDSA
jgi:hypothetical protein